MEARRGVRFLVIAVGLASIAVVLSVPFLPEPYPAFVGPSFGRVLDQGDAIVIEDAAMWVEVGGERRRVELQKVLSPLKAPKRFIVQTWIQRDPFTSPEAKQWLRKRLKASGVREKPTRAIFQWIEKRYDPVTGKHLPGVQVIKSRAVGL